MPFKPKEQPKCALCNKSVYAMEEIPFRGQKYHIKCFKCSGCKKALTPNEVLLLHGAFMCSPCVELRKEAELGIYREPAVVTVDIAPQGQWRS